MKRRRVPALVSGLLALAASACDRNGASTPSTAPEVSGPDPLTEIIDIPGQTLIFEPSRDDITVAKVIFSVYCSHPDEVRINGVQPDPAWNEVRLQDEEIIVDRRIETAEEYAWIYIDLPEIAKNRFELAPLKIEVIEPDPQGMICMSVKAWFNEVGNQYDSLLYENTDDRYALVSYCTSPPERSEVRSRFKQNQVAAAEEFKDALTKPFAIRLKPVPLREEWMQ